MNDTTSLTPELQYLLDRQDIQDTISRYSLGQDSHQGKDSNILDQWDETFTSDGRVDYRGRRWSGRLVSRSCFVDAWR
jgi:SnoaL-like domain